MSKLRNVCLGILLMALALAYFHITLHRGVNGCPMEER